MADHGDGPFVLVVDDDEATRVALEKGLTLEGHDVVACASGPEALRAIAEKDVELVITDLVMSEMTGLALLEQVHARRPDVPVVVCTGYGTIESAVEAIRKGASDYLTKPVDLGTLAVVVERALRTSALSAENRTLRQQLLDRHEFHGITGRSSAIVSVCEAVEMAAPTDVTVLVRGESGTGKEVVARAIHSLSRRSEQPLVIVDCAAMADSLIESELFGHERGAFTGADRRRAGKLEVADGGTVLLDEIGELTLTAQTRLLRFLQDHTFERVGSTTLIHADVRVIVATNRSLEEMISEGRFREDLYYRLNVIAIEVPPLRDRPEDVELLAQIFVRTLALEHGLDAPRLHKSAIAALRTYGWPGNVRELRNLCESLVVTASDTVVTSGNLPPSVVGRRAATPDGGLLDGTHSLAEIERHAIFQTLIAVHGNKAEAARVLGIGLKTLYRRLNEYEG